MQYTLTENKWKRINMARKVIIAICFFVTGLFSMMISWQLSMVVAAGICCYFVERNRRVVRPQQLAEALYDSEHGRGSFKKLSVVCQHNKSCYAENAVRRCFGKSYLSHVKEVSNECINN